MTQLKDLQAITDIIKTQLLPGDADAMPHWRMPCVAHRDVTCKQKDSLGLRLLSMDGSGVPVEFLIGNNSGAWERLSTKSDSEKDDSSKNDKVYPASEVQILTALLWNDPEPSHKSARMLAVGDPLASLVTVVWEANDKTTDEPFLEHFLHRYFVQMRVLERTLAQRPGLQLVMVLTSGRTHPTDDDQKLKLGFLRTTQQLMRKLGEAALDVQIRWIDEKTRESTVKPLAVLLTEILRAHGLGFDKVSPKLPEDHDKLKLELNAFRRNIEDLEKENPVADSVGETLIRCLAWSPELLPYESNVKFLPRASDSAETSEISQPSDLLLSAYLKVRRFTAMPLWVDLAPVTLIASENAVGKTTLVEALSQLYMGRARVRTCLPEGANVFISDAGPCEISVLRLTSAPGQPLGPQAFLPLFAEDVELDRGRIGEISLLSLFPVLDSDGRTALLKLLDQADRTIAKLQQVAKGARKREPVAATTATDALNLEGDHLGLWTDFLNEWEDTDKVMSAKRDVFKKTPEPDREELNSDTGDRQSRKAQLEKELLAELKSRILSKSSATSDQPVETDATARPSSSDSTETLTDLVVNALPLMLAWLVQTGKVGTHWSSLDPLWQHPSTNKILRSYAGNRVEELAYRLQRRLQTYCDFLAQQVFPNGVLDRVEQAVEHFLDTDLELPQADIRANTARQVRKGFAARIARWLAATHGHFPILIVDEPVLGQDSSAAAAAVGRFLRLRRIHEGLGWARWARSFQNLSSMKVSPPVLGVTRDLWEHGSHSSTPLAPPPTVETDAQPSWPLPIPPQVILTSHLSATLVAAADSEGVVLDLELQQLLRKLILYSWVTPIRDVLKGLSVNFESSTNAPLPHDWKPLTAAALVRCWSMPTDVKSVWCTPPEWRTPPEKELYCWWKDLRDALTKLRLEGLHYRVVTEAILTWTFTPKKEEEWKEEFKKIDSAKLLSVARSLILWLIATDLLPAILADAQAGFEVSGVALRQLPAAGGEAFELGPSRLRRVGAWLEDLPPDPVPASKSVVIASPAATADSEQPVVPAPVAPVLEPVAPATSSPVAGLPSMATVGVWRGQLISQGEALPPELGTALAEALRAAGILPHDGEGSPPQVLLHAPAQPTLVQTDEFTWCCSWVLRLQTAEQGDESLTYKYTRGGTKDEVATWVQKSFTTSLVQWLQTHSDLTRKLELLRLRSLPSVSGGECVAIGIWTYIKDEVADPEVAYTFGALVPEQTATTTVNARETELRERWEARITRGLLLLRQTLGGSGRKQVRFYPKCHPAVAVRAGVIFSHRTGFSVEVVQNGSAWDLDLHKVRGRPNLRIDDLPVPGITDKAVEIHVLLSFTQDVHAGYEAWRMQSSDLPRAILHISPPGGPGRDSVPRELVTDLGESIVEALIRRKITGNRLRFFIAAPNALSFALGRSMNALGDVRLMDWIKEEQCYLETFKLMC